MAVTIQAPLAAQLFQLGGASDVGGGEQKFKGNTDARPRGFDTGQAPPLPSHDPSMDPTNGRNKALGTMAQAGLQMYMQSRGGSVPVDSNGNGYGLGGNLVTGDAGNATYAGTKAPSLFSPMTPQSPPDNGYRDANPYALDYSNNKSTPTLFNYGGHYGGSTY